MFRTNRFPSSPGLLFGFMDSFLILTGILLGIHFRFRGDYGFINFEEYVVLKLMLIVLVIQVSFYYFDLYDSKVLRERKRTAVLLLGSLGASSIILAVIYYMIPHLTVGRGIFAISLFLIFILTFSSRLVYSYALRTLAFKEKVLIIGTGELATKIKKEITENGYDNFEIVGFIDENRDNVREERV